MHAARATEKIMAADRPLPVPRRLKDSDVTWLYGPLHTSVDAVPPPKESTTSDRLGLEPLRSISSSKKVAAGAATTGKGSKKSQRVEQAKTKPILKYRSLSDILMPAGATSPVMEDPDLTTDDQSTISIHHARSDSSLVRLNSLNRHDKRKKKRGSPLTSPRSSSPERASDSSSSASHGRKEHRHISFNHRVEQCIAVDSTDEARRFPSSSLAVGASRTSSDEEDEEDDVLTFKSSPRAANAGPGSITPREWEPHTIARLGPTTLKNIEAYPAPSPVVFYPSSDPAIASAMSGPPGGYGQATQTYSAKPQPPAQAAAASSTGPDRPQTIAGRRAMYDYSQSSASTASAAAAAAAARQNWDPEDEDDYAMGFDYYSGGDVGVGDEYDMAQYGSTHLVGGTHNNFGAPSYVVNPYAPGQMHIDHATGTISHASPHAREASAGSSSNSSSNSPTPTPQSSSVASAAVRGPYAPPTATREAGPPKRSILKSGGGGGGGARSRESSTESSVSNVSSSLSSSPRSQSSLLNASSPTVSSGQPSPSTSPHGSSSSLGVTATSIPQHVRPNIGSRRPSDDTREEGSRGRSTSRGSSASLDRAASADRRSSSSISPSSYSPPNPSMMSANSAGTKPIGIATSRRVGSYESLNGLVGQVSSSAGTPRSLSDVTEASSESEADTVKDGADEHGANGSRPVIVNPAANDAAELDQIEDVALSATVSDGDTPNDSGASTPQQQLEDMPPASVPGKSVGKGRPAPVSVSAAAVPDGPVSPPLVPAPSPIGVRAPGGAPRFRQPSPSHATTSTTEDEGHANDSPALGSLSNSPALNPADLATTQWSDESVPSYARRSLLRAARGNSTNGSHSLAKTTSRDSNSQDGVAAGAGGGGAHRGSVDSGRHSPNDYDLDYWQGDELGGSGLVGRTLEVAGTAKDLLGAISKSLWGGLRK